MFHDLQLFVWDFLLHDLQLLAWEFHEKWHVQLWGLRERRFPDIC